MNRDTGEPSPAVTVSVTLQQRARGSQAVARLRWQGRNMTGVGLSRVEADIVGDQLALARALSDLGRQLSSPSR